MIQRVQTLYLLGAVILGIVLFFVGIAQFNYVAYESTKTIILSLTGISVQEGSGKAIMQPNMVLIGVNVFIVIDCLAAIFLFKNRRVQLLLCKLISLAVLVLTALLAYSIYNLLNIKDLISREFLSGALLPLLMLIMVNLAARNINKDEQLVRSADRIR